MNQNIKIFTTQDGQAQLEVALEQETVWLSQAQMGELFGTTPENILMHLRNIFNEVELDENRTTKEFLVVRKEGQRQVRRKIKHYNLDAIISVGYRVSSSRATQFRQWATQVLKQHLVEGYTLNQKRLQERGVAAYAGGLHVYIVGAHCMRLRAIANRPYETTVVMRKRDGHTMAQCCCVCGRCVRSCCRGGLQPPVGLTRCMRTVLRAITNRPHSLAHLFNTPMQYCLNII